MGQKQNNGKHSGKVGYGHPPVEHQFSSENQPANAGRKPLLKNLVAGVPDDAKEKINEKLWQALRCGDRKEAVDILKKGAEELGEYGFVLQAAIVSINRKGLEEVMRILEWFFGRPKTTIETVNLEPPVPLSPRKQKKGEKK